MYSSVLFDARFIPLFLGHLSGDEDKVPIFISEKWKFGAKSENYVRKSQKIIF